MNGKLRAYWLSSLLVSLAYSSVIGSTASPITKETELRGPYLGQTPPDDTPVVFALPVDSTSLRSDMKFALSPDGKEALLGVRIDNVPTILRAVLENGRWSKLAAAGAIVANQREKEPFFSPDGKKLFFVRYSSILVSNRTAHSWSTPELLGPPINENAEQYHPTTTLDGTLYFCSNRGGAYNIYRSKCESGKYVTVEKLDPAINLHENGADGAYDPYIAPDESYLIFSSTRAGGYGKGDQYISFNKGGHWTKPNNLGSQINVAGTEYGSYVTPDNKYYFFARWDENMRSELFWVSADFIDTLRRASFAPAVKYGTPNLAAKTGRSFQFTVPDSAFVDDDGINSLVYSAVLSSGDPLPIWLSFNPGTKTFSGKPVQPGRTSVRLSATDPSGEVASTHFTLTVSDPVDFVSAVAGRTIHPPRKGPWFGEILPGDTPVPFAPGVLDSVSGWIEATEFSPDGSQFFFALGTADYSESKLFYSQRVKDAWSKVAEAPFCTDFIYSNEPAFSPDGSSLTFAGKREGGTIDQWTVSYAGQRWGTPVALPPPFNSDKKDHRGSRTTDGTYYFCSNRSNMMQIYRTREDSDKSLVAELLPSPINVQAFDGDPCIAPDGHYLLFYSARDGKSADLYVSFRDAKGNWLEPTNMGPAFNSPVDEYGAHFSTDGKYLFFTRHSTTGNTIYWVAASAIEKFRP